MNRSAENFPAKKSGSPQGVWGILQTLFAPLASLRLTVTLFALGIFIVLMGTLAQTQKNMWDVRADYFHTWLAWIELQVLFPPAWFPNWQNVRGSFPFPGGTLIGVAMAINLLCAHLMRFKIQAKGARLVLGVAILVIGAGLTYLVIAIGQLERDSTSENFIAWNSLWQFFKAAVSLLWLAAAGAALYFAARGHYRSIIYWIFVTPVALLGLVVTWILWAGEDAYLGDSGMRILWQLMLAEGAALFCLAGCLLVFKKRGGVVLLHVGIGLIMFGELMVDLYAVESRITLAEGETTTYASDSRTSEFAVVDRSGKKYDEEVVIPETLLREDGIVAHPWLPFDVLPVQFLPNTRMSSKPDRFGRSGIMLPSVREAGADFKNPASAGAGLAYAAIEAPKVSGTDANQVEDIASAYLQLVKKGTNQPLGTFLVTSLLKDQSVEVAGKTYDIALRPKRLHKPFSIRLKEVRKDDYLGTNIPQNYSSEIQLIDPGRHVDRELKIWMNNPLRYAGETYYQSGYNELGGRKMTTLAVVTNMGWMIPYVGCMLVATGLLAHFSITLLRFLRREIAAPKIRSATDPQGLTSETRSASPVDAEHRRLARATLLVPVLVLSVGILWVAATVTPRASSDGPLQYSEFAQLPIVYQGRVKPFATLARNSLLIISQKTSFKDTDGVTQPAQKWLIDLIAHTDRSLNAKVFRIENFDVLHTLGLSRRKGYRYAYNELAPELEEFKKQVRQARAADRKQLSVYQKKILELDNKIELFLALREAHRIPERAAGDGETERLTAMTTVAARLAQSKAPRAVPDVVTEQQWEPLATALTANWIRQYAAAEQLANVGELADHLTDKIFATANIERLVHDNIVLMIEQIVRTQNPNLTPAEQRSYALRAAANLPEEMRNTIEPAARQRVEQSRTRVRTELDRNLTLANGDANLKIPVNETAAAMGAVLQAYRTEDATQFNRQLENYRRQLAVAKPAELNVEPTLLNRGVRKGFGSFYQFESYFNQVAPFATAWWLYLLAFVLAALGLLVWQQPLNRAALWLILLAFALQTVALLARIYISGRPPVTNLYSSAIFIGWGCVLLAIILELIYRMGIGNIVAAVIGVLTLQVADGLAADGDTFVVLQAVLDTQFWLATHVVCITLGYATTFLAGGLGILYVLFNLRKICGGVFPEDLRKALPRMIYGVLCFAIFFSFVGTVLGGLWADDSWGRFWGWDPKENGALIIVLWNALVLHARWAGLVQARGLAVLAVAGNITTTWSWFGVNELGVGLHSYGFTEGVLVKLSWFVLSQLLIILLGCLPLERLRKDRSPLSGANTPH